MDKQLKAHDVLELKARLTKELITDPWIAYMDTFLESISGKNAGSYSSVRALNPETGEMFDGSPGAAWVLMEHLALRNAEAYLIAAQMNPLITLAAADIPDDLRFEEHIVPSPCGFLVFENPWPTIDVHGKTLLTRVVTWQPMADQHGNKGIQVTEYSAISDMDDISKKIMALPSHSEFKKFVGLLGDLQVQHIMPLRFGLSVGTGIDPEWDDNKVRAAQGPVKSMLALWMLMQQRVTETVVPSMTPRSERRWERRNVTPKISVINLRHRRIVSQTAAEHESGGTREWSGRWMVKGHWRNQPFGPGRQDRHWVYIHPYLKGPDDKPFIQRPKVYKLNR